MGFWKELGVTALEKGKNLFLYMKVRIFYK